MPKPISNISTQNLKHNENILNQNKNIKSKINYESLTPVQLEALKNSQFYTHWRDKILNPLKRKIQNLYKDDNKIKDTENDNKIKDTENDNKIKNKENLIENIKNFKSEDNKKLIENLNTKKYEETFFDQNNSIEGYSIDIEQTIIIKNVLNNLKTSNTDKNTKNITKLTQNLEELEYMDNLDDINLNYTEEKEIFNQNILEDVNKKNIKKNSEETLIKYKNLNTESNLKKNNFLYSEDKLNINLKNDKEKVLINGDDILKTYDTSLNKQNLENKNYIENVTKSKFMPKRAKEKIYMSAIDFRKDLEKMTPTNLKNKFNNVIVKDKYKVSAKDILINLVEKNLGVDPNTYIPKSVIPEIHEEEDTQKIIDRTNSRNLNNNSSFKVLEGFRADGSFIQPEWVTDPRFMAEVHGQKNEVLENYFDNTKNSKILKNIVNSSNSNKLNNKMKSGKLDILVDIDGMFPEEAYDFNNSPSKLPKIYRKDPFL